ncbi:MAG: LysM peptidoglycan-binding domain-containing protein [Pseudomonadota bacterium]
MAKGVTNKQVPATTSGGRRNFRLSPLEIMVALLIFVAVLYLLTVWATSAMGPEPESAQPVMPPGTMIERALAASEKVLAEQVELSREVGALRKQVEALQASRGKGGGANLGAADASQDRRLDEMEKSIQQLSRRPGGAAVDLGPLNQRLDSLEKALKSDPAPAAPAIDAKLLARVEALEKAAKNPAPAPAAAPAPAIEAKLLARIEALEKTAKTPAPAPAAPAAPGPAIAALAQQETRLQRLEALVGQLAPAPAPAASAADSAENKALNARLESLETDLHKQQTALQKQIKSLDAELERQEKGVAADRRLAALEKRLNLIEQRPQLAAGPKPEPRREERTEPKAETKHESRPAVKSGARHEPGPRKVNHLVRSGETLMGLARRYRVSVDDIVRWNASQLGERRLLWKGETLLIYPAGSQS